MEFWPWLDHIKQFVLTDNWSKGKLQTYEAMSNVPVLGQYMNYLLDVRADEEYLRRYKMDYSDIHDPRKLRQTSSGSRLFGESIEYVSKSVSRLYR